MSNHPRTPEGLYEEALQASDHVTNKNLGCHHCGSYTVAGARDRCHYCELPIKDPGFIKKIEG